MSSDESDPQGRRHGDRDEQDEPERTSLFKDPVASEPVRPSLEKAPSSGRWAPPATGRGATPPAPPPPQQGGWAPPAGAAQGGGYAPMPPAATPVPGQPGQGHGGSGGGYPGDRSRQPAGPVLQLADYGERAAAALVDFLVRLGILLGFMALGALLFLAGEDAGIVGLIVGAVIGYIVGTAVYAPVMMGRTDGRTIGHRAAGTRIVNADGRPMTSSKAFVREVLVKYLLMEVAGGFFFVLPTLVNYLFPLWDEGNEALHDKICTTRVVKDT